MQLNSRLQAVANSILKSESTEVGTSEYHNKLEVLLEIIRPLNIEVEGDIHAKTKEELITILFDIVFSLNSKYESRANYSALVLTQQEVEDEFDPHDPEIDSEISEIKASYSHIWKLGVGVVFQRYSDFHFQTMSAIERYALACVLLDYCAEKGVEASELWQRVFNKEGRM